jgi:hypothetical protein
LPEKQYAHPLPGAPLSTKRGRQSTKGYAQGSDLSVDRYASYELDGDARHGTKIYPGSTGPRVVFWWAGPSGLGQPKPSRKGIGVNTPTASAGQGARRTARRTRRYGGEVHGACGAMQAEERPYGAGEQGD